MTSLFVANPAGEVILDDVTRVYSGGKQKKIDVSTLPTQYSWNGLLHSAYDGSLLSDMPFLHNVDSDGKTVFPYTMKGNIYLWQPKDGHTIGVCPGGHVTAINGEEGCLAIPNNNSTAYMYPIKLMSNNQNGSGYLDVMDEKGQLLWSATSLINSPTIIHTVEIDKENTEPFTSWNKYFEVPNGYNPDNVYVLSMSASVWNAGEESWSCAWVNITRKGNRYYYRGTSNDSYGVNIKTAFSSNFLIYFFYVPNS
ncbi:hypothetical protein [Acinetobacter pittii]|uniref:hypothetical protein n=1 Tax=Acinetobacter pittii TaxID=48296 RepID=UPI00301974BB